MEAHQVSAGPSHRVGALHPALTARENEVLARASHGDTNAEVAIALGITTHAVKFHLGSIFRKLGAKNRTEAAVAYLGLSENRNV